MVAHKSNAKRPDVDTAKIIEMYSNGMSATQIADKIGVFKTSVSRRLSKAGVKLRGSSDYKGSARYWLWKGDGYLPEIMRKRNQRLHRKWSNAIKERDGNKCQDCGAENVKLHAHHIISLTECLNTRLEYDVDNGIALCVKCHFTRHKIERLSKGNTTP
jgi:5-methylcytosine-specific restriction endonuclease McrA